MIRNSSAFPCFTLQATYIRLQIHLIYTYLLVQVEIIRFKHNLRLGISPFLRWAYIEIYSEMAQKWLRNESEMKHSQKWR